MQLDRYSPMLQPLSSFRQDWDDELGKKPMKVQLAAIHRLIQTWDADELGDWRDAVAVLARRQKVSFQWRDGARDTMLRPLVMLVTGLKPKRAAAYALALGSLEEVPTKGVRAAIKTGGGARSLGRKETSPRLSAKMKKAGAKAAKKKADKRRNKAVATAGRRKSRSHDEEE